VRAQLGAILRLSADHGFLGSASIDDQIDHALGFRSAVEQRLGSAPSSMLDLGTGGGLPGLVLVASWPNTRIVLFDANQRRTDFLRSEIESWDRTDLVEVVRGRAEEFGRIPEYREHFQCVVARSFGSPGVTAECGSSFLEVGGLLVVSEPPTDSAHDRWSADGLEMVGLVESSATVPFSRFRYQLLEKYEPISDRYPRRVGIPVKRPLF
jgi:16S rRNA (guanine527-N7)-methyltransferase